MCQPTQIEKHTHKLIQSMSKKTVDTPQQPGCQAVRIPRAPNGSLPLLLAEETLEHFCQ